MIHALRQIRSFLTVARFNNFTRAAAELHLSQSALTVQIKQLEEELDVVLFDRNKRRVALTQSGHELLPALEGILVEAEALVARTRDLTGVRRGLVTVAVLPSIGARLMPGAFRRFSQLHPGVAVRIVDVVSERVLEAVLKEQVDFGVGTLVRRDKRLAAETLLTDVLCAFVPRDHLMSRRKSVTLRELATHPLILTGRDSSVRSILESAVKQEGLAVTPAYEVSYMSTAIGMAAAGLGIAILPDSAVSVHDRQIHRVSITRPALRREIVILRTKGRSLSPAAAKMVEVLRSMHASFSS